METGVLELALVRKDCKDENKGRHFLETSRVFALRFCLAVWVSSGWSLEPSGIFYQSSTCRKTGFKSTAALFPHLKTREKKIKAGLTGRKDPASWLELPVIATFLAWELRRMR